eukprot:2053116-Ditylum_brightwellii.AAC.1
MDIFLQADIFSSNKLLLLNYCRLFLHITNISDMATSDGRHILSHILSSQPQQLPSPWKWPQQQNPNTAVWKMWKKALTTL